MIEIGMDPDHHGAFLKLAQTESSRGDRESEACVEDCKEGDDDFWSCWSECMGEGGEL